MTNAPSPIRLVVTDVDGTLVTLGPQRDDGGGEHPLAQGLRTERQGEEVVLAGQVGPARSATR
jgi:hydroxymethylpyrimidine pyrophosphatase-like HAD family hydrolase